MSSTGATDPKADLREYLRIARETMLWKLDGLSGASEATGAGSPSTTSVDR